MKVKICGIKNPDDALFCEANSADAIGLVFHEPSPRNISLDIARDIADSLPPFITVSGLFVDPEVSFVNEALQKVKLDCLQFHGAETNDFCEQFGRKWCKAIKARPNVDLAEETAKYPDASAILVDSYDPEIVGGTGKTFNWARLKPKFTKPLILAGGLNPQNVKNAVDKVKPWAVDVSGGVESSNGVKDQSLIADFIKIAKG